MDLENFISTNYLQILNSINNFPGLVIWKDLSLNYRIVNCLGLSLFGLKKYEDCSGKSDYDLTTFRGEDIIALIIKMDNKTLNGNLFKSIQFLNYPKEKKLFVTTSSPIKLYDGVKVGIAIHAMDMSSSNLIGMFYSLINKDSKLFFSNKKQEFIYVLEGTECHMSCYSLTARESECLFYIVRRKTAKEIAKILSLSPRTVETHIVRIKDKLNCTSKSQLIDKAINEGLINNLPKTLFDINDKN